MHYKFIIKHTNSINIPDKFRDKPLYSVLELIIKSLGFKISSFSFKYPMIPRSCVEF